MKGLTGLSMKDPNPIRNESVRFLILSTEKEKGGREGGGGGGKRNIIVSVKNPTIPHT